MLERVLLAACGGSLNPPEAVSALAGHDHLARPTAWIVPLRPIANAFSRSRSGIARADPASLVSVPIA